MNGKKSIGKIIALVMSAVLCAAGIAGCSPVSDAKLDPKNPTTVTIWHYYGGAVMNAFNEMLREFNDTVGLEQGIIVEGESYGSISELRNAVLASAKGDVGSRELPNIFAAYADLAVSLEPYETLADLSEFVTEKEREEYILSYWDEGRVGADDTLRIFPIAKSTEVLLLNETDWQPFAAATGFTHADLASMEGIVRVGKAYYEWTDAKTPDVPYDGMAFWGRDSISNLFVIGCKQLGVEIFGAQGGKAVLDVNKDAIRRIWDNYYIPFIRGYFSAQGQFRSEDVRVGEILAYVGSTASAAYFPTEVTTAEGTYAVESAVLPAPVFEGGRNVMVQQGAGMVVTKAAEQEMLASTIFLKWATDIEPNTLFAAKSGYMPVMRAANDIARFMEVIDGKGIATDDMAFKTLEAVFATIQQSETYAPKAFDGATETRSTLDSAMTAVATASREAVLAGLAEGLSLEEAAAPFCTDEAFDAWYNEFSAALYAAAGQ